ncbi:MAG: hypothetical protein FMNOHCHN_01344 [Ignavibacteriaceae bacterium]|nr:hypothetical protein [Ignavibacteriaceae bacterium]
MRITSLLRTLFIVIIFIFPGCASESQKPLADKIALTIKDTSRVYSFTNKRFSQLSGETNSLYTDGWHGWTFREQRVFNDFYFGENEQVFDRKKAVSTVTPYDLTRDYGSVIEMIAMPDSLDAVFALLSSGEVNSMTILNLGLKDFTLKNGYLALSLTSKVPGYTLYIRSNRKIASAAVSGQDLIVKFTGTGTETKVLFFASENDQSEAVFANIEQRIVTKKNRIEALLQANEIKTNDKNFDQAYLWAIASADALVTEQQLKGIFAGLPWFNNYWGRDTFISLPGAAILPGNLKDARNILLSFAKYQNLDKSDRFYGRIPNRITLNEVIYNTADGTPRWVIQAYNYYKASGDEDFLKQIAGNIKTAFEASLANFTDKNGFITHDDADTWMDAKGPQGPWSPRGNRANDIQALWYQQLDITEKISYMTQDTITALRAAIQKQKLVLNFEKYFYDEAGKRIYDHLNADGSPDLQMRPNIYPVLNASGLISDYRKRMEIILNSAPEIISPRGVLSLSWKDENFHPYHQNPPYYVKDAAYHNGIIWQWTSGPAVSAMVSHGFADSAWVLIEEQTHQILHRWGAGTLAELSDAMPRNGEKEPRLSGTWSQAWSLAEYIRNINEDFLGWHPDAPGNAVYLLPSLPKKLTKVEFKKQFKGNTLSFLYDYNQSQCRITVRGEKIDSLVDIGIALINYAGSNFQIKTDIQQDDILTFEVPSYARTNANMNVFRNGSKISVTNDFYADPQENKSFYSRFRFAQPQIVAGLKSLRGPDYELLPHHVVKADNKSAKPLIIANDKLKDEKYQYPLNPNFPAGILDIESLNITESDSLYHFTVKMANLHNPGWHQEYGYQLTLLTLLIDGEGYDKSALSPINSKYAVSSDRKYSRAVIVGGGYEVRDAKGKVLAAYMPKPEDIANPLGSVAEKTISFSVPKRLIGVITAKNKITLLSGGQDDHGGAGTGEFRAVGKKAEEWSGGGRMKDSDDLVYDILLIN